LLATALRAAEQFNSGLLALHFLYLAVTSRAEEKRYQVQDVSNHGTGKKPVQFRFVILGFAISAKHPSMPSTMQDRPQVTFFKPSV